MTYEPPPPQIQPSPPTAARGYTPPQAFPPAARGRAARFQKAVKAGSKLRAALFGPSGSGKTYSALRIATGMGGRIAVVDTERETSRKYADRFEFDVCALDARSPADYIDVIRAADGYDILIIDSLTHAWHELLQSVDQLATGKFKGNSWAAWSKATPQQRALVDAMMSSRCHIIATMRSNTEWAAGADGQGRSKPIRVGLKPEQGKGIEYEFDLLLELNVEHVAEVIKDRTGKFQDKLIAKPDEHFGAALAAWLTDQPIDDAWAGDQGGSPRVEGTPPGPASSAIPPKRVY